MQELKILIVEDEETGRLLLNTLLSPLGVCDEACNGREAITLFEAALKAKRPYHLILLDIMMPELDGQRALRAIREMERRESVPAESQSRVLMVTALSEQHHILEAFMQGGATGYLVKPIEKKRLYLELEKLGIH